MVTWKIPTYRHDLGKPELDRLAKVLEGDDVAVQAVQGWLAEARRQRAAPTRARRA